MKEKSDAPDANKATGEEGQATGEAGPNSRKITGVDWLQARNDNDEDEEDDDLNSNNEDGTAEKNGAI